MNKPKLGQLAEIKSFDVALSFSGADRVLVENVADRLISNNALVFYDRYFEVDLLGSDLVTTLRAVYSQRSRYCAVFISATYGSKRWPNHVERTAILDRASRDDDPYLIPIVLDDSWLNGLPTTTGFLDGRRKSAEDIAEVILAKIGIRRAPPDERELFMRLALDAEVLGRFLINFRDCVYRERAQWSGDTSRLHALHSLGRLLSKYHLCDVAESVGDGDMDFSTWVRLSEKGIRFRDFLLHDFIQRIPTNDRRA